MTRMNVYKLQFMYFLFTELILDKMNYMKHTNLGIFSVMQSIA